MTNVTQHYKLRQMAVSAVVGFLACSSFATTARYFKFTPTAYADPGTADGYNLAMSEFVLLDGNGGVIAWPQGTAVTSDSTPHATYSPLSCIVDGQHDQKCIIATPSSLRYPYIQIDAGEAMDFAAYGWWSSQYSNGDKRRISTAWTVEISSDGQSWVPYDERTGYPEFQEKSENKSEYRGPFAPPAQVSVAKGETYVVQDGDPLLYGGSVELYGTLDLNGHSLTLSSVRNLPTESSDATFEEDQVCDLTSARIVNGSSTRASLTVGSMNFGGSITETVGAIDLTLTDGTSVLLGQPRSIAPSKIQVGASATLFPYSLYKTFCFRFKKNRAGATAPFSLGEIQMTYGGKVISPKLYTYLGASPSSWSDADDYIRIMDGVGTTCWTSLASDEKQLVRIVTGNFMAPVDGYRLCAPENKDLAPTDWEVYAYYYKGWVKVDERQGVVLGGDDDAYMFGKVSTNFTFSSEGRAVSQFGDNTEISNAGVFRMRDDVLSFGKLSGSNIKIESGLKLASADYSDWTGAVEQDNATLNLRETMGHFLIDATRGGPAAQRARFKNPKSTNLSIENATMTPASLLVDATWPNADEQPQYGRVADGKGPMGIVKRDNVKRILETKDAAYTGETRIEEGTLEVRGTRSVVRPARETARYFRFTPTAYVSSDSSKYNFGLSEIQLLDSAGAPIAWPAGVDVTSDSTAHPTYEPLECLADGVVDQKCIIATGSVLYPYVLIDAGRFVNFNGYQWYSMKRGTGGDEPRLPTGWKLEISLDRQVWKPYDQQSNGSGWGETTVGKSALRGPFLRSDSQETYVAQACSLQPSLPSEFFADVTERSSRAPSIRSRYFRIVFHQAVSSLLGPRSADEQGIELADLVLFYKGAPLAWPSGTSALGSGSRRVEGSMQSLLDNDPATSYYLLDELWGINIDAGEALTFDAYGFRSSMRGNELSYRRLPTSWVVEVSSNRSDWVALDTVWLPAEDLNEEPGAMQGPWLVGDVHPLLADGVNDALGDKSPVNILSGAMLEINCDYEKFGPLSGTGVLELYCGATAHANALTPTTFGGLIAGKGTFVGGGTGGQTLTGVQPFAGTLEAAEGMLVLDDASFPNVSALTLSSGGVLTGSGSFGGDLDVNFSGGAWNGVLTVGGALNVTGDVVFQLPMSAVQQDGDVTVMTIAAASIPSDSRSKLQSATLIIPSGARRRRLRVVCDETTCRVEAFSPGMMIMVR